MREEAKDVLNRKIKTKDDPEDSSREHEVREVVERMIGYRPKMLLYDALPKVIYYDLKKEGRADESAGRTKIGNTGAG